LRIAANSIELYTRTLSYYLDFRKNSI